MLSIVKEKTEKEESIITYNVDIMEIQPELQYNGSEQTSGALIAVF